MKINIVSALSYFFIKEILYGLEISVFIDWVRWGMAEGRRVSLCAFTCVWVFKYMCVCVPVCFCVFMSWLNGPVELNDLAACFIFPRSSETGRRLLRLPSISLWPQSFTGSSWLPQWLGVDRNQKKTGWIASLITHSLPCKSLLRCKSAKLGSHRY